LIKLQALKAERAKAALEKYRAALWLDGEPDLSRLLSLAEAAGREDQVEADLALVGEVRELMAIAAAHESAAAAVAKTKGTLEKTVKARDEAEERAESAVERAADGHRAAAAVLEAAESAVRRLRALRDGPASADLLDGMAWPPAVLEADRREALAAAREPHLRALGMAEAAERNARGELDEIERRLKDGPESLAGTHEEIAARAERLRAELADAEAAVKAAKQALAEAERPFKKS
jgi:hypothetical protein